MGLQRDVAGKRLRPLHGMEGLMLLVAVLVLLGVVLIEEACSNDTNLAGPEWEPETEVPFLAESFDTEPVTFTDGGTLTGPDKRFYEISASVLEFGGYWMTMTGTWS